VAAVGSATAAAGNWSITASTLTAATHSITAKATDIAGNQSVASGALSVTIDTTSPAAPSTPDLDPASDTGSSNTDNVTGDTTPTFTGTAESGAMVTVFDGATAVGPGTATGGTWTITTSTLTAAVHSITANATDVAGNQGSASAALSVTIDTTAPAAPSTPDLTVASDSGSSNTDNITNVATPTFTGTAEATSTVTIFDGTTAVGTGTATGGNYSITTSTLTAGTHSITAKATDPANNTSVASGALPVTIDIAAPAAPSTPDLTAASDSGSSNTDNITIVTTPTFTGTAEANSTVAMLDGAAQVGSATATSGTWTITSSTLTATTHSITAKATDAAGNQSAASAGLSMTIDTTAPATDFTTPDEGTTSTVTTSTYSVAWTESDIGSSVAARSLQQGKGTIVTQGTCDGVTPANDGAPSPNPSPFVAAIQAGFCYEWTQTLTDTAGNIAVGTSGWVLPNLVPVADFGAPDEGTTVPQSASTTSVTWIENGTVNTRSLQQQRGQIVTAGTCSGVTWTADGPPKTNVSPVAITALLDGYCYRWTQTLSDGQGHQSTSTSGSILVDSSLPVVSFTAPTADLQQSGTQVVVSWTESDGGAGFGSRSWKRQALVASGDGTCLGFGWFDDTDEAATPSPQTETGLINGWCYRWTVALTDAVGNTAWATSTTVLIDTAAPTADFVVPNESTTTTVGTGGSTVSWTEGGSASGLQTRSLQRQMSSVSGGACSGTWTADGPSVATASPVMSTGFAANTCYRWVLTLTDGAGNSGQQTSGVLQNAVAVLSTPIATGTAFETESLTASTTLSSVTQVEFLVDGSLVATDSTGPYSASVATGSLADGSHQLQVRVTQTGGTVTTSPASAVTVANNLNSSARIAADYSVGALSLDNYVINGVYSLLTPHSLPSRFETVAPPSAELGSYLQYWDQVQQATRDTLQAFFDQPFRMDLYQPTQAIGGPEPQLTDCNHTIVSPPYHGMGGFTEWYCETLTPRFDLIYVVGPSNTATTVDRADPGDNGVADSVEAAIDALDKAYNLYAGDPASGGLGFDQPISGANKIKVTLMAGGPNGNITDAFSRVNIDPTNFTRMLRYAAPHEIFHVFQYGYKGTFLDRDWLERNFWYESTAQWASRKYVDFRRQSDPTFTSLDWTIGDVPYLDTPQLEPSTETQAGQPVLNPSPADQRIYGAWVLATHLESQFPTANIIRRTWDLIRAGDTAKQGIAAAVNEQPGASIDSFMQTYAQTAFEVNFADATARDQLMGDLAGSLIPSGDPRFTGSDPLGPARPARQTPSTLNQTTPAVGEIDVGELGMTFITSSRRCRRRPTAS
jgi:hypothetical protein